VNYNNDFVKFLLLLVTAPIWWPFIRELWKELDGSLKAEGGLLGLPTQGRLTRRTPGALQPPPPAEHVTPLVHEPLPPPGQPMRPRQTMSKRSRTPSPGLGPDLRIGRSGGQPGARRDPRDGPRPSGFERKRR
jgi:hypothetical protein